MNDIPLLHRVDSGLEAASKTFRIFLHVLGYTAGTAVFLLFFAFFVVLPIAFFVEVVASGERELHDVKDQMYIHIVDSLPTLPTLPALTALPALPALPSLPTLPVVGHRSGPMLPFSRAPSYGHLDVVVQAPDCDPSHCEDVRTYSYYS